MSRPAADRGPTASHTRARLGGGGRQGCSAQRRHWRPRSGDQGGGGGTGGRPALGGLGTRAAPGATRAWRPARGRRPLCPGDAAAAAGLPGPGPEPLGDPRPCAVAHGRASVSPLWLQFGREGAGGPRARPDSGSARPQGPDGNGSGVALIRLMRPDGSRSPQHVLWVFSFLFGLFNWCDSLRLGCGLITQRASRRLRVLSGEPRGFPGREDPKEPATGKLKAAAGPASPEPRTDLRRPGNRPRYSARPCERERPAGAEPTPALRTGGNFTPRPTPRRRKHLRGADGVRPWRVLPLRGPSPTGSLSLRGGALTHCPLTQPVPGCPTEPSSSTQLQLPQGGVPSPAPRGAPPSAADARLGGGGPSPRGTSSSAGAEA